MKKTQKQIAQLLGTSIKAIHSYEQGWRTIPPHVERQMFFLLSNRKNVQKARRSCWTETKCPSKRKKQCPAWEFNAGKLCWFINGTICKGAAKNTWKEKMQICRSCDVFISLLEAIENE